MADAIWIDILPSVRGFAGDLAKGVGKAAKDAGSQGGKEYSAAFDSGAKGAGAGAVKELEAAQQKASGSVKKLASDVSTARQGQQKSAADLLIAEQKLTDASEKYGAESNQAQAAALKVEAARGKAADATGKFQNAEDALREGQKGLTKTTEQLEEAQGELTEEVKQAPGLWGKLTGAMGEASDGAEDTKLSFEGLKTAGKAVAVGVAAAAAAVVGGGVALYNIGGIFDDVGDTIRVGTGATGDALDSLVDSAKRVGATVPAEFEEVGTTVADVNTRLGLSGKTLETFSSQVIQAGKLFGEELNIGDLGGAFKQFNLEGEELTKGMDHLYRVSQGTGVGMNDLAKRVEKYAPAVKSLGFSFEDTAAMVGLFDRAGLDADGVMTGMGKGLLKLAKDGEKPKEAFHRVVGGIGEFIKKGDEAGALNAASKVFGVKGATQFVDAIKSGTLAMDDLSGNALFTGDTILGAAAETADFAEQWQIFKNRALLELEPVATRVFGIVGNFMTWVNEYGIPAVKGIIDILFNGNYDGGLMASMGMAEDSGFVDFLFTARETAMGLFDYIQNTAVPALANLGGWIVQNKDWLMSLAVGVGTVVAAWALWNGVQAAWQTATKIATGIQLAFNLALSANPIGIVVLAIAGLVAGLAFFFTQTEVGKKAWSGFMTGMQTATSFMWNVVIKPIFAAIGSAWGGMVNGIRDLWNGVLKPSIDSVGAGFRWMWTGLIKPALDGIRGGWGGMINGVRDLWNGVLKPVLDKVGFATRALWDVYVNPALKGIRGGWDKLAGGLKSVWDTVIKPVFDVFAKVIKGDMPGAFEAGKKAIDGIWKMVQGIAAKPINFVIKTVYNNGLRKAINKVRSIVGGDDLPELAGIPGFAKGGLHKGGWAMVGEEGPELVNFASPGRVYTAGDTRAMLAGKEQAPEGALNLLDGSEDGHAKLPIGGNPLTDGAKWLGGKISDAWKSGVEWARGGLAKAAAFVLNPIKDGIAGIMPKNHLGNIGRDAATQTIDGAIKWIRGKDEEEMPGGSSGAAYDGPMGKFHRPSRGPYTSMFGPRWGSFHAGVDIAGGGPTFAALNGVVRHVGWGGGLPGRTGHGIRLAHGGGFETYYGHNPMNGVRVKPGDQVKAGQHIGYQGATGNVTGTHLHFETLKNGRPVNPMSYLYDGGGVLQPGITSVVNASKKPEMIYTNAQDAALKTLAARGAEAGTGEINVTIDVRDLEGLRTIEEFVSMARRKARQR